MWPLQFRIHFLKNDNFQPRLIIEKHIFKSLFDVGFPGEVDSSAELEALLSGFQTENVILNLLFHVIILGRFCFKVC